MNKIIGIIIITILTLLNTQLTFAQGDIPRIQTEPEPENINEYLDTLVPSQDELFGGSDKLDTGEVKLVEKDLEQEVAPRLLKIIVQFSAVAGLILMVFAGIRLIFARDDEEEIKKAKQTLIYALIGVLIISGSFALIVGLLRIFDNL